MPQADAPMVCPFVEGVLFTLARRGRAMRCLILADTLQTNFGATADPDSWLRTFEANRRRIVHSALTQASGRRIPRLVILRHVAG